VRIGFQRGREGLKGFAFVFHFVAGQHGFDDLDALAHHGGRADFFSFLTLTDFLHEDF
jgi:hypothetical protein